MFHENEPYTNHSVRNSRSGRKEILKKKNFLWNSLVQPLFATNQQVAPEMLLLHHLYYAILSLCAVSAVITTQLITTTNVAGATVTPVSYTHLDVYKRQSQDGAAW